MYRNIGKTIKVIAIILQIIFLLGPCVTLAASIMTGENVFGIDIFGLTGMMGGIVISVAIMIAGFIAGLSLYAYGDMAVTLRSLNGEDADPEQDDQYSDYEDDADEDDYDEDDLGL